MESIYRNIYYVFDQIRNLQIALPPKKKLGGEGASDRKTLPPSPFTGQFIRKANIWDWSLLVISSMGRTEMENSVTNGVNLS